MSDELKGKSCLVTGASGFIGTYMCQELRRQGAKVTALLRKESSGEWDACVFCKLGEHVIPSHIMKDVDIVFHLAGHAHSISEDVAEDNLYFLTNVNGTRDLLQASKNEDVEKFVYFSSVKSMGEEATERLDEAADPKPLSSYGKSKLEAENLVINGGYVASPTVLRLPMVYGASEKGNLPRMVNAISKNWFPPFPKIKNKRSMIHVDDVVQGAILAATNQVSARKTYILCDDIDYSTRQLYEIICMSIGKKVPSWGVPVFMFYLLAKVGDLLNVFRGAGMYFNSDNYQKLFGSSYFSCDKAKLELGFSPKRTLAKSISRTSSGVNLK